MSVGLLAFLHMSLTALIAAIYADGEERRESGLKLLWTGAHITNKEGITLD